MFSNHSFVAMVRAIVIVKSGEIRIALGENSSARVILLNIAEHTWV